MVKLAHLADIHIGSGNRSAEYRAVFDQTHAAIVANHIDVVVIAGDIFHNKTKYTGSDVADFEYLVKGFNVPVIIIPGNHDVNMNDLGTTDLIDPIVNIGRWPNVIWQKQTSTFIAAGVEFTHISVFDERTAEQLNADYPMATNSILIYHGFISGAVFGKHTVRDKDSKSRITNFLMDKFRAVIAGDIHGMQIFGPPHKPRAYSGSLIQQNMGESTEKGFLIWDIDPDPNKVIQTPTFFRVPNSTGMIAIDIRGKTDAEIHELINTYQAPDNVLKVALYTDSTNTIETENALRAKFGRLDKINRVGVKTGNIDREDISMTLTELLYAKGIDDDIVQRIAVEHAAHVVTEGTRQWCVVDMHWSNLGKYGRNNYIDFTSLVGISGVIAQNRAGKSTIIDILVWALYGECLRANKDTLVRHGEQRGDVTINFVAGGEVYRVEKSIDRNGKTNHKFNKVLPDGLVNLTGSKITETTAAIVALIGPLSMFMSTGLYYDDHHNLVECTPAKRMVMIPELFGIEDANLLSEVKTKIKTLTMKLAAVPPHDPDAPAKLATAIALNNTAIANLTLAAQEHADATAAVADTPQPTATMEQLYIKYDSLCDSENQLQKQLDTLPTPTHYVESAAPITLTDEETAAFIEIANVHVDQPPALPDEPKYVERPIEPFPIDQLTNITTLAQTPLPPVQEKTLSDEEYNSLVDLQNNTINKIATTTRLLNDNIAILKKLTSNPLQEQNLNPNAQSTLDAVNSELEVMKNKTATASTSLAELKGQLQVETANYQTELKLYDALKVELQSKVAAATQAAAYQFNPDCANCIVNRGKLAADLEAAIVESTKLVEPSKPDTAAKQTACDNYKTSITAYNAHISKLITAQSTLQAHVSQYSAYIDRKTAYDTDIHNTMFAISTCEAEIATLQTQHTKLTSEIATVNNYRAAEEQRRQIELAKTKLAAYNDYIIANALYNDYVAAKERCYAASSALVKYNIYTTAVRKLAEARDYVAYTARKTREELTIRIAAIQTEKAAVTNLITTTPFAIEARARLAAATTNHLTCQKIAGETEIALKFAQAAHATYENYITCGAPLKQELDIQTVYRDCLISGEFRSAIITNCMNNTISAVNDYLTELTDFTINYTIDTSTSVKRLDLHMIEQGRQFPIELGSGFQRFIVNLLFRIVISAHSCQFLMIDEHFGVLDEHNTSQITGFFNTIKQAYSFIFIISHVTSMQAALTTPLYITSRNGVSSLNSTQAEKTSNYTQTTDGKLKCVCGAIIMPTSQLAHEQSRKHTNFFN